MHPIRHADRDMNNRRSFVGHLAALLAFLWNGGRDRTPLPEVTAEREVDARLSMIQLAPWESDGKWAYSVDGAHWRSMTRDNVPTMVGRTLLRCERYHPATVSMLMSQFHCVDGTPISVGRIRTAPNDVRLAWAEIARAMKTREWMSA